jgi:acetyltransferase-like isoleucine patch superfamily enzyme
MKPWNWPIVQLGALLYRMRTPIARATLPRFGNDPKNLKIDLPRNISGAERIHLGEDIELGPGSFLIAVTRYPGRKMASADFPTEGQMFEPNLRIGNRVTATANLQIFAQESVIVEDDVMFASNVFLNDGSHGYQTATVPYKYQPIFNIAPIVVGRGSWIGQNVVIMPGVTIGEYVIIGANSVVTKSVPPRCIAAGSPARILKRWDEQDARWIAVAEHDRSA